MTKFLNNQLRGEGFISMHSFSLQSLGSVASGPPCAEAECHGGGAHGRRSKVFHLMVAGK